MMVSNWTGWKRPSRVHCTVGLPTLSGKAANLSTSLKVVANKWTHLEKLKI